MAANHNDSPQLRGLVDQTCETFAWFAPSVLTGVRGYDAKSNFEYLYLERNIDPVIQVLKATAHDELYDGFFNEDALPSCVAGQPMTYVGRNGKGQHLFRCQAGGAL
jgi:hypothetical protein